MTCQKSIKTYLKLFYLVDQVIIHTLNLFRLYNLKCARLSKTRTLYGEENFRFYNMNQANTSFFCGPYYYKTQQRTMKNY